jgi:hypothetical protein
LSSSNNILVTAAAKSDSRRGGGLTQRKKSGRSIIKGFVKNRDEMKRKTDRRERERERERGRALLMLFFLHFCLLRSRGHQKEEGGEEDRRQISSRSAKKREEELLSRKSGANQHLRDADRGCHTKIELPTNLQSRSEVLSWSLMTVAYRLVERRDQ